MPPPGLIIDGPEYFVSISDSQLADLGIVIPRVMLENCDQINETYKNVEVNYVTKEVFVQRNWIATYHEVVRK